MTRQLACNADAMPMIESGVKKAWAESRATVAASSSLLRLAKRIRRGGAAAPLLRLRKTYKLHEVPDMSPKGGGCAESCLRSAPALRGRLPEASQGSS